MKIIGLSVLINEQTPVYPGDPVVKISPQGIMEKDGYNDHLLSIGTHAGTHIDAPIHMIKSGKNLDELPIEKFIGRGKYVRVDGEFSIDALESVGVEEGDIVIFETGMGEHFYEPKYFTDFPAMTLEVAEYLVANKVKIVGTDTCSPDKFGDVTIHKLLLGNGVLIIENLTNLSQLEGLEFTISALPLRLDIDAAPARVIAIIE